MAIISAGYDGTVDEIQWAKMMAYMTSSAYGVAYLTDFQVSAVAGQDRTVKVAPGLGWGHGVLDESDADISVSLAAPVSGSRYDMIVLRRDWQPPGGSTTVAVVQGGATKTTLPTRENTLGVLDDQPLALVRVDAGSTVIGEIIDIRVWGRNGATTAKDELVLQYLNGIGSEIKIGRSIYTRVIEQTGAATWQKSHETYMKYSGEANYTLAKNDFSGQSARVNFPTGMFQAGVVPNIQITVAGRTPPYHIGRINTEVTSMDHTGFNWFAYRTDGNEVPAEIRFKIHWLALQ